MADVTITPANVSQDSGGFLDETAGEAIDAGEWVYKAEADGKVYLADSYNVEAEADVVGMAINSAPGANQPIRMMTSGVATIGNVVSRGTVYVLSATKGKMAEQSDLTSYNYVTVLCVATSGTQIRLGLLSSGAKTW